MGEAGGERADGGRVDGERGAGSALGRRQRWLGGPGVPWGLAAAVALLDATVASHVSLGVLYFFPVVLGARRLTPRMALLLAATCAVARILLGPVTDPLGFGDEGFSLPEGLRAGLAMSFVALAYLATTWLLLQDRRIRGLVTASETDPLTGVANRRGLERALHMGGRASHGALMVLDIDHFKRINDQHGHDVGDRVLAEVAGRARRLVRADDLVARFGGEEFVVVLPGATRERAREAAEQLRHAIAASPVETEGAAVAVTASVGVAHGALGAGLLVLADRALYAAKEAGRDRVCEAPP